MSIEIGVEVEGNREMREAFRRLSDSVAEATLRRAGERAGSRLAEEARRRAPERSGGLAASMAFEVVDLQRTSMETRVSWRTRGSRRAPHGHLVEFGTRERRHESGKSVGAAPRQPFLRPAYEALRERLRDDIGDELRRAVMGAAG